MSEVHMQLALEQLAQATLLIRKATLNLHIVAGLPSAASVDPLEDHPYDRED